MTKFRWGTMLLAIVVFSLLAIPAWAAPPVDPGLAQKVAALEAKVAALEAKLQYMSVEYGKKDGLNGPHVIFANANVHVRSGLHATNDGGTLSGLGNLIVGYNENNENSSDYPRTGSHNLVVGQGHGFTSYGGFVAGEENKISGKSASVSGGFHNTAGGEYSSVSGGRYNTASQYLSSVSGGAGNTASGAMSSVSGGVSNTASGDQSAVSGGEGGTAEGYRSAVSGGIFNTAHGFYSSVSGGINNTAAGPSSSVSGGSNLIASGTSSYAPYP